LKTLFTYMCIVVLLSPLVGCNSTPRPPLRKGPPLHLYVNVPDDGAYWVESTARGVGRYGFLGEELRLEGVTRFVYQMRSVHRTRAGETRLAITPRFYTIDDWVVTPRGYRMRPPEMEVLFGTIETVIRNHPFTITLDQHGDVVDSDGLTEMEDALAGVIGRHDLEFPSLDPLDRAAWRRVFMNHIDERPIRRHFQQTFGFLPDGLVRLGDRWIEAPANKPWPFFPTEERVRLIDQVGDHYMLETETEYLPPAGSNWAPYRGNRSGHIQLDPETRLGVLRQESVYWKRKRKRTPWEQFTLKSLEGSETVRITEGPFSASPRLNAINRYPFLEE
jgi:hypothetical protein